MTYSIENHLMHIREAPEDWEPTWLVDHCWMKNGLNIIVGAPKSHKSVLRRYLLSCVLSGTPAFDEFKIGMKVKNILMFIGEDHPGAERSRISTSLRLMNYDELPNIHFIESTGLWIDNKANMSALRKYVKDNEVDLVLFDSLRSFHMQGENDSLDINRVFGELTKLKRLTTVVVIHHSGKGGFVVKGSKDTRTVGEMSRGSGAIAGYADTTLALSRTGYSNRHRLRFESKYSEEHEDMELRLDPESWLFAHHEGSLTEEDIVEFVKLHPGTSKANITQKLGYRKKDVLNMLDQMEILKGLRVEHGGRGKADKVYVY